MGKIHKDLKRAEKEYIARKRQQLPGRRKPSHPKIKAYLVLIIFTAIIFGQSYFRTSSTEYPAKTTVISRKFPLNIVTANSPAKVPSHGATMDEVPGMQLPEFQKDVEQQLKISSRPEPDPKISPQSSNNTNQTENQKSDVIIDRPLDDPQLADFPIEGTDRPVVATKSDKKEPADQSQNRQEPLDLQISPYSTTESEFLEEPSKSPVFSAKPTVDEKEEPPDPAKLIDWLLKKRSVQNE